MNPKEKLRKKLKEITGAEAPTDFCALLNASMEVGEITTKDFAEKFSVSRPTVDRWRRDKNRPRSVLNKYVYEKLLEYLKNK